MNIFNHWKFILNFLNYKDIINLSYVSKKLNYFVKKDIANQIKKFPDIFVINYDNLPFLLENNQFEFSFNKNILIKYCTNIKNFKFLIEKNEFFLEQACKLGNIELIELCTYNNINWSAGLRGALKTGKIKITKILLDYVKKNLSRDIYIACKSGNVEIINLLMEKHSYNWDFGLAGACKSGNMKIIDFVFKKGIKSLCAALLASCKAGNEQIFNLIIKKCDNKLILEYISLCLFYSCYSKNLKIMKFFMKKGINIEFGLMGACLRGSKKIINFLIEKGAKNWNCALVFACRSKKNLKKNDLQLINFLIGKGANNFDRCYISACKSGNLKLMNFFGAKLKSPIFHGLAEKKYVGNIKSDIYDDILECDENIFTSSFTV